MDLNVTIERKVSTIFVTIIVIIALVAGGYRTVAISAAALLGLGFVIWFSLGRLIRLVPLSSRDKTIERVERPCWVLERLPGSDSEETELRTELIIAAKTEDDFILKFRSDNSEIWITHVGVLSRYADSENRLPSPHDDFDTQNDVAQPWYTLRGTVSLWNLNHGEKVELEFHFWSGVKPQSEAAALDQVANAARQLLANGKATVRKDHPTNEAEE